MNTVTSSQDNGLLKVLKLELNIQSLAFKNCTRALVVKIVQDLSYTFIIQSPTNLWGTPVHLRIQAVV